MGILQTIISHTRKNDSSSSGTGEFAHSIDKGKIFSPTDPDAITPLNPGNFETIRTQAIVTTPQYFEKEQANTLREIAKAKVEQARHSVGAYKALQRIEKADTTVHVTHRGYEKSLAKHEAARKKADIALGKKLHTLRPQYAQMGLSLNRAESNADKRIEELASKVKEYF